MGKPAVLAIKIVTDASAATKGMDKASSKATAMGKSTKLAAVMSGAAIGAAVSFAKASIGAAGAAAKANRTLGAVMGDAAGKQSEQTKAAIDYADALAKQDGISRNVIKSTQTVLAAYSNLNPKVTGSADAFNRATAAAQDLAAAGFGDAAGNAKMLGKALQDPAKYTKALARMGVVFTAQEQDQIKVMMKHNDVAGAQKVILSKLERQVGGTAKAQASSSDKTKVAMEGMQEAVGKGLLPVMKIYSTVMGGLFNLMASNAGVVQALALVFGGLAAVVLTLSLVTKVQTAYTQAQAIATKVNAGASKAAAAAQWLWNAAMSANPIGLIVIAIVAVVAAVIIMYKKFGWFRDFVNAVWAGILAVIRGVWSWIKSNWPLLIAILLGPIGLVVGLIIKNFGKVKAIVSDVADFIGRVLGAAFNAIKTVAAPILDGLRTAFGLIHSAIQPVIDALNVVKDVIGKIKIPSGIAKLIPGMHTTGVTYASPGVPVTRGGGAARASSSSAGAVNVNVYGTLDPQGAARAVQRALYRANVRGGRARFA